MWTGYLYRAFAAGCVCLAIATGLLGSTGCNDAESVVLSAAESVSDRQPAAGQCRVHVTNESTYAAAVQVDSYIEDTLVHHSEFLLASVEDESINQTFVGPWDEADRVVISASIENSQAEVSWSEQTTYLLDADFESGDTIEYSVVYPPVADAPVVQIDAPASMLPGDEVTLDGSASYDPQSLPLTYAWEKLDGPDGTLSHADLAAATFLLPAHGESQELTFRLTVSNGQTSASQEVTIDIGNRAPVASVTGDLTADESDTVVLDGSASDDPDGDTLTYEWEQLSGTPATILNADQAVASFVAPAVGVSDVLIFRLTVSDGELTDTEEWNVTVYEP